MSHRLVQVGMVGLLGGLAGCGIGFRRALTTDEVPVGTCAKTSLVAGESCRTDAREYAAGVSVGVPREHSSSVTSTAWVRWPLFDALLDQRTMYRGGGSGDHSLAGGVGTHLRPMILWPRLNRYVDILVNGGFELGGIKRTSHVEGRADAYLGAALDLFAPDVGSLHYLEHGVPGVRIAVRHTWFVQGYNSDTTVEVGLIWRLGVPIENYRHWTIQRTGD